jgi:hypothetical protein
MPRVLSGSAGIHERKKSRQPHSPEVLKHMRDHLAELKAQGTKAMD